MADPFPRGLFGLPSFREQQRNRLAEMLMATQQPEGVPQQNAMGGFGRLDVQGALAAALSPPAPTQERDPAYLGPPTIRPGSGQWWVDQAAGLTPVGGLMDVAEQASALPDNPSWGQLAPVIGGGILAAAGAVPGGRAIKKGGGLAMDLASRQARADRMFPMDVFHGTAGDFTAFDPKRFGQTFAGPVSKTGVSVSPDPRVASHFADVASQRHRELREQALALDEKPPPGLGHPSVMPLRLDPGKQAAIRLPDEHSPGTVADAIYDAWEQGYDSVRLTNYTEVPGLGATEMIVVRRPEAQLRSRFARFDPAKKNKGNLMDSLVPLGTAGGVTYMMMPGEASAAP